MNSPLLTTKLHIPRVLPSLVPRPRLIERLNEGPRPGRPAESATPALFAGIAAEFIKLYRG